MSKKIVKILILLLLTLSLIFIILIGIFGTSLSFEKESDIKKNREYKNNLIKDLKINNTSLCYDEKSNTYYYTIPSKYLDSNYILKLELDLGYKYKLIGKKNNIVKINYNKPIDVIVYNKKYYFETKIQLTNLPLININTSSEIKFEDSEAHFNYINQANSLKEISSNIKVHIRGSSSKALPKKSYKISIYDKKYDDKKNIQINNFYFGDSFILDSVYRDGSKIRNLLSLNLWNEISNDFSNVNVYGEFIELFINNEYMGLYVFTEPINRKKMNLSKDTGSNTGSIIKLNNWIDNDFYSKYDISDDKIKHNESNYLEFEIKYPNSSNLYEEIWDKFISTIDNYYDDNIPNTDKVIEKTFNKKNYIDIILFNSFINNVDNCLEYNNYYYFNSLSDEIFIQPWDMEFSYGYYINPKRLNDLKYNKLVCEFYQKDADKINDALIDRYWSLRKKVLTKEYFDKYLNEYKEELTKGASLRDSNKWHKYDVEKEIEEIRTWIYKRIEFFDDYVKELENEQ